MNIPLWKSILRPEVCLSAVHLARAALILHHPCCLIKMLSSTNPNPQDQADRSTNYLGHAVYHASFLPGIWNFPSVLRFIFFGWLGFFQTAGYRLFRPLSDFIICCWTFPLVTTRIKTMWSLLVDMNKWLGWVFPPAPPRYKAEYSFLLAVLLFPSCNGLISLLVSFMIWKYLNKIPNIQQNTQQAALLSSACHSSHCDLLLLLPVFSKTYLLIYMYCH